MAEQTSSCGSGRVGWRRRSKQVRAGLRLPFSTSSQQAQAEAAPATQKEEEDRVWQGRWSGLQTLAEQAVPFTWQSVFGISDCLIFRLSSAAPPPPKHNPPNLILTSQPRTEAPSPIYGAWESLHGPALSMEADYGGLSQDTLLPPETLASCFSPSQLKSTATGLVAERTLQSCRQG